MRIDLFDPTESGSLAAFYNRQMAEVPFCFPVSEGEFTDGLSFREADRLRDEAILVASEGGRTRGFLHLAREPKEGADADDRGILRFFAYEPGNRRIGEALLDEAERRFREMGIARIGAFEHAYAYRFHHLGFGLLTDRMAHVFALLQIHGYETRADWSYDEEVFLEWRAYAIEEPALPDEAVVIEVSWEPGRGRRPNLGLRAIRDGEPFGECECLSVGEFSNDERAQDAFFTEWLGVRDANQGRGWGRYLLRRALWELHGAGYRDALISANRKNYRALLFYANEGYRVVDSAYALRKTL